MALIDRVRPSAAEPAPQRFGLANLLEQINYLGQTYPLGLQQTYTSGDVEEPDQTFSSMVTHAYKQHGPVFACVLARGSLFSEARFLWQRLANGRPGDLFGTDSLRMLERPWPNGTTGELLWRAEQSVSLAGNCYLWIANGRFYVLRPDWVHIILGSRMDADHPDEAIDTEVIGYMYKPPNGTAIALNPDEVIHWSPIPDPLANYRGMSWLAPIIREVTADKAAVIHKEKFFENGATVNLVVLPDASISFDEFKAFKDDFTDDYAGAANAYKTLFLGGGSNVETVGSSMKDMDYSALQGVSETRTAAAANVPPIIAGFSEGLASATYSNYGMARRKFGDHFARPQWRSFAAAIEPALTRPSGGGGVRLWYDDRDIAFLREDQGDEATIRGTDAATVRTLVEAGFSPDAAVAYVQAGNLNELVGNHSGLTSVQLVPPGGNTPELPAGDDQ